MTHPFDIFIGTKIKMIRKRKGISQTALARAVGITFQQVQKYERGDNRVSISRLYDISKALDVSLAVLVSGFETLEAEALGTVGEEEEEIGNILNQLRSDEMLRLIECYAEIEDPGLRKSVLAQVEALARAASKERGGSERILVVEDDAMVRNYVVSALESLGYDVKACASADEAIAIARHGGRFDLLFTDIVLPGETNGFQLAAIMRTSHPGLRVLFTTGFSNDAIGHDAALKSDAILLRKPYRKRKLAEMVRVALDEWPGA
ncbi:MAG: response regulator [Alphaproteobacteria bacterium]|nr:response regulator [Alphaproteobacteria bacterium]MDX5367977.1 response regulator [Alphaproteobacteria bacterium]MDX5462830.1 response regulator [Alphaproteobacteria bacterium]